jgi:homocysteine S-methyltransferase
MLGILRAPPSGQETWLVFHRGVDLPDFAAFPLLDDPVGRALLVEYFGDHVRVAQRAGTGIVLETPTWRANCDWGARLGYDAGALDRVNRDAVALVRGVGSDDLQVVVSGCLGPKGDGYHVDELVTPEAGASYHQPQIESFVGAGADRVSLLTATHTGEAIGVVKAATAAGIPAVVAFTVETDGRLPSGQALADAINDVDSATANGALYFGVNCAHPDHLGPALDGDARAIRRIALVRANASRASHSELNEAEELDDGDPEELAQQYGHLISGHPHLGVLGGCCGTDLRHVEAIARVCIPNPVI